MAATACRAHFVISMTCKHWDVFRAHPDLDPHPYPPHADRLSYRRDTLTLACPRHRYPQIKRTQSGPGSYNPKKDLLAPHAPMVPIRGRPPPSRNEDEGAATGPSVGPGSHNVPERPRDTTPAGRSAPASAFARRQYMPPAVNAERKQVLLAKSRSDAALHKYSVTREGRQQQQTEWQQHCRLRASRSVEALARKTELEEQRLEKIEQTRIERRAAACVDCACCPAREGSQPSRMPFCTLCYFSPADSFPPPPPATGRRSAVRCLHAVPR